MTPPDIANARRNTPATHPVRKSASEVAALTVGCGFAISMAYFASLILIGSVFGWEGDLANFFVWATPTLPILSLAVGSGLLAVRTSRPVTRAVAAIACLLLAFLAFFVARVAWAFTMTDWLVW